jgi:RecA-family ATPase
MLSDPPIIEGMLREREVAAIVASPKSCKTWIAMDLALSVAAGTPFLRRNTVKKRVLYIDYELKEGTLLSRISKLSTVKPVGLSHLCLRGQGTLPTQQDLKDLIREGEYGLVIIDSLYKTGWLSEENSNDSTARELNGLQEVARETGAAIVVIDHTAKGGGAERSVVDSARGASSKGGFFDDLFLLREPKNKPKEDGVYVEMDTVFRDLPSLKKRLLIRVYWEGETEASVELVEEIDKSSTNRNEDAVRNHLQNHPDGCTYAELMAATGIKKETLRRTLLDLNATKAKKKRGRSDVWLLPT